MAEIYCEVLMAIEHPGAPNPETGDSLLAHLEAEELAKLNRFARTEHYPKGAVIFRKGERGTSMMTVAEGRIKISASSRDGKEAVLAILAKGDVLGEMAILDGGERSADATALEPTELVVIDQRDFIPFLERNPKIAVRLLRLLSERLRRTSEQVEDRAFLSLSARLAKTLLDLADEDGRPVPEGITVAFGMSQRNLAALLGVSRESVNKQLSAWQAEGLIALGRGEVTLIRREALERIVEGPR